MLPAMLEQLVEQVKSQIMSSLEENVYQQAVSQDLGETTLRKLVEAAIDQLQIEAPAAAGGLGAVMGFLSPFVSQLASSGLGDQIKDLLARFEVDQALRDTVIRGLTRYLEENAGRLVTVALEAITAKLGKTG
jgi:hypothetical protein